ncbi:MAG: phenylacetate-CoA oxygenase subunit PaaJ [Bacteroidia bacterium]|nr:phenylacetate-CoA oxygenase subunit PaaJ [Bacteroidia bacterium]
MNSKEKYPKIWEILEQVSDPEIPVLSIIDLGVVRDVREINGQIEVDITPTYSGCPAMNMIETEIKATLDQHGIKAQVKLVLSPAWTTDWMSESGKNKLREYGIAPPQDEPITVNTLFGKPEHIECPRCKSKNTELISQFGSTACKALYKCLDCLEPFDYFKCHR